MAFEKPSPVTALTQELRFATTMTGGVSLAIWMAGVTREINLLAQASQWRRLGGTFPTNSQLTNESAASLRLYAQLIDLLDMVVDVDILSGTSAGGINAALLASSRVTGSDLGGIRDLWLDLGALTELLRDPRDKKTPSLLYGDERIFAALAKRLPKLATGPFPPTTFGGRAHPVHHPVHHDDAASRGNKQIHRLIRHSRPGCRPPRSVHLHRNRPGAARHGAGAGTSSAQFRLIPTCVRTLLSAVHEGNRQEGRGAGSTGDGAVHQPYPSALG